MKQYIFLGFAAFAMSACASSSQGYGPAQSAAGYGYKNTQIQQDRFRVSYTADSVTQARDLVLLRAAEVAIGEGYSHFKVINGGTSGNGPSSNIASNVGVGFGNYGRRNSSHVNLGLGVHDLGRALEGTKVTESIEIIAQKTGASDPNVYDAQDVINNLRPAALATPVAQTP